MPDSRDPARTPGFATRAIHAGQAPDPTTGSVIEYSRTGNPTRTALQECLAALEGGAHGLAFASGMAATDALIRATLRPGDHLVIPDDAYGGTFRLIDKVFSQWGITHTPVPLSDVDAVRAALQPSTRLVWVETPTNPLLNIADITAIAEVAHAGGAKLVVDNTFASPYLQNPLALGADVVLHSTTKYVGGHSDVVGGALVTDDSELREALAFLQNGAGGVPGPFDAWLTLRGAKTLALRMEQHSTNAELVVQALLRNPAVASVLYPGLAEHPGHAVAARQMRRFGGMVSLRMAGGREAAEKLCAATEIFTLAESLGGVESLIELPSAMTHASTVGSMLEVPQDLVRLSVGIEDGADLVSDLEQALAR
jgi:cystathionine gamma-synthase